MTTGRINQIAATTALGLRRAASACGPRVREPSKLAFVCVVAGRDAEAARPRAAFGNVRAREPLAGQAPIRLGRRHSSAVRAAVAGGHKANPPTGLPSRQALPGQTLERAPLYILVHYALPAFVLDSSKRLARRPSLDTHARSRLRPTRMRCCLSLAASRSIDACSRLHLRVCKCTECA